MRGRRRRRFQGKGWTPQSCPRNGGGKEGEREEEGGVGGHGASPGPAACPGPAAYPGTRALQRFPTADRKRSSLPASASGARMTRQPAPCTGAPWSYGR